MLASRLADDRFFEAIMHRVDAVDESRRLRANAIACSRAVGCGEGRNVWSNAIIARDEGRPWIGVDYSALRRAIRIDDSRREVYNLRSRIVAARCAARWPATFAARTVTL